jgi:hypothetical protein
VCVRTLCDVRTTKKPPNDALFRTYPVVKRHMVILSTRMMYTERLAGLPNTMDSTNKKRLALEVKGTRSFAMVQPAASWSNRLSFHNITFNLTLWTDHGPALASQSTHQNKWNKTRQKPSATSFLERLVLRTHTHIHRTHISIIYYTTCA